MCLPCASPHPLSSSPLYTIHKAGGVSQCSYLQRTTQQQPPQQLNVNSCILRGNQYSYKGWYHSVSGPPCTPPPPHHPPSVGPVYEGGGLVVGGSNWKVSSMRFWSRDETPSLGVWGKWWRGTPDSSGEEVDLLTGLWLLCVVKVAEH